MKGSIPVTLDCLLDAGRLLLMLTLNGAEPVSSVSPVADGGRRCDRFLSLSPLLALFTVSLTVLFFNARTSIESMSLPNPPRKVRLLNHVITEAQLIRQENTYGNASNADPCFRLKRALTYLV